VHGGKHRRHNERFCNSSKGVAGGREAARTIRDYADDDNRDYDWVVPRIGVLELGGSSRVGRGPPLTRIGVVVLAGSSIAQLIWNPRDRVALPWRAHQPDARDLLWASAMRPRDTMLGRP
jgi:hypothetical protein